MPIPRTSKKIVNKTIGKALPSSFDLTRSIRSLSVLIVVMIHIGFIVMTRALVHGAQNFFEVCLLMGR